MSTIAEDRIRQFCDTLIHQGVVGAEEVFLRLVSQGFSQRTLYLQFLAPAAQRLGCMWQSDEIDFLTASVATVRIENIIRTTRLHFRQSNAGRRRTALFASVPGEGHTLGVKMAAELQRSKGWEVAVCVDCDHEQLVAEIKDRAPMVVGLSISQSGSMHHLYSLVKSIKALAVEPKILVSGGLVAKSRDAIRLLGVDAFTSTYPQAERSLNQLIQQQED